MRIPFLAFFLLLGTCFVAQAKEENELYELSVRASKINPQAKEHPEINYTFAKVKDNIVIEVIVAEAEFFDT
ncbi:MAG: hypothetical protein VXV73_04165, partial [Actinomycetota bacterium]|nr:hypothetical protein [Actinomycetota bacterium]